ncbi:MAG: HDIG domain-containing protein, partial [Acidobacteriota bacterium]
LTVPAFQATEERRQEERARIPPVYNFENGILERSSELLTQFFETGREYLASLGHAPSEEDLQTLRMQLPFPIREPAFDLLVKDGFSEPLEAVLRASFETVRREKVVDNRLPLLGVPAIRIREIRDGGGVEIRFDRLDSILSLEEARGRVSQAFRQAMPRLGRNPSDALAEFLEALVNANLRFDSGETARRREMAADRVGMLVTNIPRGAVILRANEVVDAERLAVLDQIRALQGDQVDPVAAAGYAVLGGLLVFFMWRYVGFVRREGGPGNVFGICMVVGLGMLLWCFALLRLGAVLAEAVGRPPFDRPSSYVFAIPVAAGATLVTLLLRARVAMVFSVFLAVVFGMLAGWDMAAGLFALLSSFTGIYAVTQYKERTAIIKAGLIVGLVNVVAVLALATILGRVRPFGALAFDGGCGMAGGILVAITVSFALPVLEWMFGVLTDIRLLELSNLNSPLLRRLAVRAPGTYNHSVIVGTLAESAAQHIGVNSLLCRVAAYYHDIGKMNKPEYFIENQMDATGRHNKLSPTMSSLIIASHVKDGIKMAREYNLPRPIVDIIPQHHGTRLITYFYKKAKRREVSEIQEVSESNFRYPGPKPQTKEAAIFMMADSVEAAARTVDEPTPAKFKDVIRKIVNAVILDDQLTETDLTFKDLDGIQESFLKTLNSIYHHRIEYPGFRFEDRPGRDRVTLGS